MTCKEHPKYELPNTPHAKYRSAVIHAQKAIAAGKSSEEAHELYRKIMAGEATGGCGHH